MKKTFKKTLKHIGKYSNTIMGGLLALALIGAIIISSNSFSANKYVKFNYINNANKYLELLNSKDYKVIYVGKTGCSYCQYAEPVYLDIIRTYDITINKIDIAQISQQDYNTLMQSDEVFKSGKWQGTPFFFVTKGGKVIEYVNGYDTSKNEEYNKQRYTDLLKKYNIVK